VLPAVLKVPDKIERLATVDDIASQLGVGSDAVLEQFRKAAADRRERRLAATPEPIGFSEKTLLNLLLSNEEARARLLDQLIESPALNQFQTRRIFQTMFSMHRSGGPLDFGELHARLETADQTLLSAAILADESNGATPTIEQGLACVQQLERVNQEARRASLKAKVKEAERAGDLAEAIRLAEELSRLERA
jgi:replicative DNA helicase